MPSQNATLDTLASRWRILEPHAIVTRPSTPGPHPAVLMFHGCGGRTPELQDYATALSARGVTAVNIDSLGPRGIGRARALATVCTGIALPGHRRAGDVLAAIWGASRLEGVDPSRIALAGWSHGGWSIMDLMTMALDRPGQAGIADAHPTLLSGVRALSLIYPYCGPGALTQIRAWRRSPDTLAIVGTGDLVAHPTFCRRAFRRAAAAGASLETWFPEGATHDFDIDHGAASPFRHDPVLAAEARERMAGFLSTRLTAPLSRAA